MSFCAGVSHRSDLNNADRERWTAPPPPATIWSFDLSKELWSRVEASDVPAAAAAAAAATTVVQRATVSWPAARSDGSVIGAYSGGGSGAGAESDAGWVVGGVGDRECRRSPTSGFTMPAARLQELTGLWRLVLVGDKS